MADDINRFLFGEGAAAPLDGSGTLIVDTDAARDMQQTASPGPPEAAPGTEPVRSRDKKKRRLLPVLVVLALITIGLLGAVFLGDREKPQSEQPAEQASPVPDGTASGRPGGTRTSPASAANPTTVPTAEPTRAPATAPSTASSKPTAVPEPAETPVLQTGPTALEVLFDHHIVRGTLYIYLDGEKILEQPLRAKKTRGGFPKIKRSHQKIRKTVAISAGRHRFEVHVTGSKPGVNEREYLEGTIGTEETVKLRIHVQRVTNKMTLSWE
jgi:hypothetical protein